MLADARGMKRQFRQAYVEPTSEQDELLRWIRARKEEAQIRSPYWLQFCLLQAALRACGHPPVASADVQGIAEKIAMAARRFRVREYLTSVKRAKNEDKRARAEDKRAREIRLYAVKLGRLLSKQDGPLAASLEGYWDRLPPPRPQDDDDYANKRALRKKLTSPFELRPSLIQLARGLSYILREGHARDGQRLLRRKKAARRCGYSFGISHHALRRCSTSAQTSLQSTRATRAASSLILSERLRGSGKSNRHRSRPSPRRLEVIEIACVISC
jgi:hypothetical protein